MPRKAPTPMRSWIPEKTEIREKIRPPEKAWKEDRDTREHTEEIHKYQRRR